MINSILPLLAVIVPAIGAGLSGVFNDKGSARFSVAVAVLTFLVIAAMYPQVSAGHTLIYNIDTGLNFDLGFMADSLSLLAGLASSAVWMLTTIYSVNYMSHEHAQRRYNFFSLASLCGMIGVVFTSNLFTLYIFFEVLTVASYVMVIHEETNEALKAGIKYLFMGVCGGLLLLVAIIVTVGIAGTSSLLELTKGNALSGSPYMPLVYLAFLFGFGVKAGIFPVHVWLPDAHPVAPSPASALLSGVMIKAGAYGIIRVTYNIVGIEAIRHHAVIIVVLGIGILNTILGSAMAMKQKEIKRLLAYSSIAQMGYIMLGTALLSPTSTAGAAIHIFNHSFTKGTLFLAAGAIIHKTGLRQLDDLKGIGYRMPITMICFTMAALSMIGFPPFVGFISKWMLAIGAIQVARVGSYPMWVGLLVVGTLILSSLMNLMYYGPIVYGAWFPQRAGGHDAHGGGHSSGGHGGQEEFNTLGNDDPGPWMKFGLLLAAMGTLVFGIFPQIPAGLATNVAQVFFK